MSPRASATSVRRAATRPWDLRDSALRAAASVVARASSQRPRENSDIAWLERAHASMSATPWLWQTSMPCSAAATASRERPMASRVEGRLILARPMMPTRPSSSARSRTAYISAMPSSTAPASAFSQPRVSRACSSMYSSPTSRAYSTARSAAARVSAPGRCRAPQPATLIRTSACTADGGRPRTSSSALASSSQPSPRATSWTSRERWTQNQAARRASSSPSRMRRAFLQRVRARSRSPPKRAATVASAIRSRWLSGVEPSRLQAGYTSA